MLASLYVCGRIFFFLNGLASPCAPVHPQSPLVRLSIPPPSHPFTETLPLLCLCLSLSLYTHTRFRLLSFSVGHPPSRSTRPLLLACSSCPFSPPDRIAGFHRGAPPSFRRLVQPPLSERPSRSSPTPYSPGGIDAIHAIDTRPPGHLSVASPWHLTFVLSITTPCLTIDSHCSRRPMTAGSHSHCAAPSIPSPRSFH